MRLFYSQRKDMKARKILLILICLFASYQISFGQEKPLAIQIDYIEDTNCEDLTARLNALKISLSNAPNSTGYVIIFGDKDDSLKNYKFEKLIKRSFVELTIDSNRVVFVHEKKGKGIKTQVWIVPFGADKPVFTEEKWDYALPEIIKPFMLHEKVWENEDCAPLQNEEFYSRLLLANPSFRGNIVIYENSPQKFQNTKINLIAELVNKYKVPFGRLKFYYVKSFSKSFSYPDAEFWLVPKKQK